MDCKIDGCDGPAKALGLCSKHYKRLKRHGDPLGGRSAFDGDLAAFIETALQSNTDECVIWPFGKTSGYGRLAINGRAIYAHREVCRRAYGDPPSRRHEAAHECRNGQNGCINPRHLRWALPIENNHDMDRDGTRLRGSNVHLATLTEDRVLSIISKLGKIKQRDIAIEFGVSESAISNIKHGKSWGWLTGL